MLRVYGIWALILFFAIFLSVIISCGGSNESEGVSNEETYLDGVNLEPVEGDWLIYNLGAEPGTLNPITATDAYESIVNSGKIYETLVKRDNKTLEIIPLLAESWEVSEDKLTFTFHLRRGVKWHDGYPFTAHDVVFSYEKIMDPEVDAPHLRAYYKDIKSIEAIDDYTVRCSYSKPYFLALEFCGGIPIVPKHVFEKGDFNTNPAGRAPVGTGPYRFVKWNTGEEIILDRNEDYWGKKPYIKRIVFKIISDPTVALQVLKREEIDLTGLTPIQWARQTSSQRFKKNFRKLSYFTPNYSYIGWNTRRPFFSDKRVRRAMTHLVNRELILEKILYNLGEIVTNPFYIYSPEYDHSIKPYPYDPVEAKKLLDEAGWVDHDGDGIRDKDGVKFEFEFLIPSGSITAEQIATILEEELKRVGIRMRIRRLEWAVFVKHLEERRFDAVTLAWSMGVESDPYQVWHSSQAERGSNFVGFKNDEADRIMEQARKEFDKAKRVRLFRKLAKIIHEEQPYTFLFCRKSTVALHKRFRGVKVYPLGIDPLEWYVPLPFQKYGEKLALIY
ncbi:MAG: peptide-binding protein [Deltaproteobacteria bacterium]|nr:MAG: peptide-binding protein [Deltaproteobacteria bacterium]